jgi:putative transposase
MRIMGLEAIYPKRATTRPAAGHKIYPYLLRNLAITRPDQVWASDITYIPLRHGFLSLGAELRRSAATLTVARPDRQINQKA